MLFYIRQIGCTPILNDFSRSIFYNIRRIVMPKSSYYFRIILPCHFILISIFLYVFSANAELKFQPKAEIAPKAEIVWSEVIGGTYQVFYSALIDNQSWSLKIQISKSDALNVAPAISSGSDGITWIVWSSVEGADSQLAYRFFDGVTWSVPKKISTHLSSNTGPSIIIDGDNIPWIVWAGFDSIDDDIYSTKWNGSDWATPSRVNMDNDVPDVLPRIIIAADNIPSVYWSGFNGDTYSNYVSTWTGDGWSQKKIVENQNYKALFESGMELMPDLPGFIKDPQKASIHIRMKSGLQSIPLQEIRLNQE